MKPRLSLIKAFGLPTLSLAACAMASAADQFVDLSPTLTGQALAVSRNGYEVVGWVNHPASRAMRYLFSGSYPHFNPSTLQEIGAGFASGLSEYGHFTVGGATDAFKWDPTNGVVTLPRLPNVPGFTFTGSKAVSSSYGGQFTSGVSTTSAIPPTSVATLWTGNVPSPLSTSVSTAGGMTGDARHIVGSVVKGFSIVPAIFNLTTTGYVEQDLPSIPTKVGQGVNISDNGRVVVGGFATVDLSGNITAAQAATWTSPFSSYSILPDISGGTGNTAASGASADGSVIVGAALDASNKPVKAVYWDKTGVHDLQAELAANGLATTLAGWQLLAATGVSADGTIIVGYGLDGPSMHAFWCRLQRPLHLYNVYPISGGGRVVGGNNATGGVFLSLPAPIGGVDVLLKTDSSYAGPTTPAVHVVDGHTTATFTIKSNGTSIERFANITGSYGGHSIGFVVAIEPADMKAFSITAKTIVGGGSFGMVALLNGKAPAAGSSLQLASQNTALGTVPATASFPAAGVKATATGKTLGTATTKTLIVKATYRGLSLTASISVTPAVLISLTTNASTITGGGKVILIANLNGNTPSTGGSMTVASSAPEVLPVHSPLAVGGNVHYKAFSLVANSVTASEDVTISVTYKGVTKSVIITVNP